MMAKQGRDPDAAWIREQRLRRGWSQRQLVTELQRAAAAEDRRIGLNVQMVSRWENGHKRPDAYYQWLLQEVFGATHDLAADDLEDDMQRRAFLRHTALAGLGVAAPFLGGEPWQRLSAALRAPTRLDTKTIRDLEVLTISFEELYARVAPSTLVTPVLGHLNVATRLLEGSQPDRLRRQLASVAAETAGLAGWLAADAGDHATAQSYYLTALDAVKEADDKALGAYIIGSASVLPAFRRSPHHTIDLLHNGAYGVTSRHAAPDTRAWLATLEAEAHAATFNASGAFDALERADDALDRVSDLEPRPRVSFFNHTRLLGERGVIAARLGRAVKAHEALDLALARLDPSAVKIRSRLLTSLATAHAQRGNIEEACQLAIESLSIAKRTETEPSLRALYELREQLGQYSDSECVRKLDEQLAPA